MYRFSDCHILITGAGSGIGKAMLFGWQQKVLMFLFWDEGMNKLEETQREISELGGISSAYGCDIRDQDRIRGYFGNIDRREWTPICCYCK